MKKDLFDDGDVDHVDHVECSMYVQQLVEVCIDQTLVPILCIVPLCCRHHGYEFQRHATVLHCTIQALS